MVQFNNKTGTEKEDKGKKNFFDSINVLYEGRELTLNVKISNKSNQR